MRGAQSAAEGSANQRSSSLPKREVASVLVGAAEICLLERSPRLAMRAAWTLLRSEPSDTAPGSPLEAVPEAGLTTR